MVSTGLSHLVFLLDRMNNDTRMYHVQAESVQTLTETSYSIYHMVIWNVDDVTQMITTQMITTKNVIFMCRWIDLGDFSQP